MNWLADANQSQSNGNPRRTSLGCVEDNAEL